LAPCKDPARRLMVFPIHWLVAQSGLEFPVDECLTCEQPAVWFSRTVGRDGAAVIYSVLRSFED